MVLDLGDGFHRPAGDQPHRAIGVAAESVHNAGGQDALAFAGLDDVVAELAQFVRQR
jgi:hypothetical protein